MGRRALAVGMARQHGVFRRAQALRLDSNKLKQRVRAAASEGNAPQPAAPAAFVELITSPASHACECVIEIEGPRGRMRIEWKGATAPDLAGFSRVLWEPSA